MLLTLQAEGVDEGKQREGAGKKEQHAKHNLDALCNAQQLLDVEEVVGVGELIILQSMPMANQKTLLCARLAVLPPL